MSASGLPARTRPLLLSPRERRLCELLCNGYEGREMAKELNMAPRTVKAYFARIYAKNGITDGVKQVKLAVLFYREGLAKG